MWHRVTAKHGLKFQGGIPRLFAVPASALLMTLLMSAFPVAPLRAADDTAKNQKPIPTLFIIGDSTVKNGTHGLEGWGTPIVDLFDPAKIHVENRALGGRSSRTYLKEGLWEKVRQQIQPGDFVLMQFGHNDGAGLKDPRNRASIKGTGDQTQSVTDPKTGKEETVHTYGWYMRQYISDTKARGGTPIVLSPVPRNIWKDGKVARNSNDYGKWARESAEASGALFIDLNDIIARRYEQDGEEKVKTEYFTTVDHTHTTPAGAKLSAACVAEGLRQLKDCPLSGFLRQP